MASAIENQPLPLEPALAQVLPVGLGATVAQHSSVTEMMQTSNDQMPLPSNPPPAIENHSTEAPQIAVMAEAPVAPMGPVTAPLAAVDGLASAPAPAVAPALAPAPALEAAVMETSDGDKDSADGDVDMSDHHEYSSDESEYQPEPDSPPPSRTPKQPKSPAVKTPKTPQNTRPPKTPTSRVRSGRVEKSGASPPPAGNLRCPVKGCGQTFTGRNPRQSLWHHLKYYAMRGLPDRQEFEKLHGEAHSQMKREAGMPIPSHLVSLCYETRILLTRSFFLFFLLFFFFLRFFSLYPEPKGTPVERNRISSSDYRKKNPEKAKTSARLSNFRARARKKGLTADAEVEDAVNKWEKEWQEKQAKEASEVAPPLPPLAHGSKI